MPTYETANGMIDTANFHESGMAVIIARGLRAIYSNEAASKTGAAIKKLIDPEDQSRVSSDAVKAWRESNADANAEMLRKVHADFTQGLIDGTFAVRTGGGRGPSVDPLTKEMRLRATNEVVAILKDRNIVGKSEKKRPANDAEFTLGGVVVKFGDLIDRRLANPKEGPRIKKEAEDHLRALQRQKDRAVAKAAEVAEATDLESLGF